MSDSGEITRRSHLGLMAAGMGAAVAAGLSPRYSVAGDMGAESEDAKAIKAQCQRFLNAIYQGDKGLMDGVFHEDALVYGNMAGEDWIGDGNGLAELIASNPPGRESGMSGDIRILALSGYSAAVELVVRDYHGTGSTDFMAMQKIGGTWQVVGKAYSGA